MRKISVGFIVCMMLGLSACSTPTTSTRVVDARPTMSLAHVPSGAAVMVDGQFMGRSEDLAKKRAVPLKLEAGTHKIELVAGGQVLFSKLVFMAEGTHTVVTP